jgi:DNA mismatch endonuclease, patch repair protein
MADVHTPEKRSYNMSQIKNRGNASTEKRFIRILRENHITGWRRRQKLFGHPDFVFYKQKVAVFLDGCFWHCCEQHCKIPENNRNFWVAKLNANRERDALVTKTLEQKGWAVVRIWEHELRRKSESVLAERCLTELRKS